MDIFLGLALQTLMLLNDTMFSEIVQLKRNTFIYLKGCVRTTATMFSCYGYMVP